MRRGSGLKKRLAKSGRLPIFVHKSFVGTQPHSSLTQWQSWTAATETIRMAYKATNIYYLDLYRKSLLIPSLNLHLLRKGENQKYEKAIQHFLLISSSLNNL